MGLRWLSRIATPRYSLRSALLLAILPAFALSGQASESSQPGVAFEMSLGLARAFEERAGVDRIGVAGAFTLSRSVVKAGAGWLVGAAHASGAGRATEVFAAGRRYDAGSDRAPGSHAAFGALAGWAQQADQAQGARFLAGPAYFARGDFSSGVGLVARVDGARAASKVLSLTFFLEAHLPPRHRGERDALALVGVGLRLR